MADTMTCRAWLDGLADYLDGRASPEARAAFERHADTCPTCARLLATVRDGQAPEEAMPDLTAAVLARTSGPACGLVERTLAARGVEHGDVECSILVVQHLEHCPRCRELEAALRWVVPFLPGMAEVQPDRTFASDVVRATARAPARIAWRVRVGEWWERVVSIPLFELQAAYVGAALLLVIGASPVIPIRGAEMLLGTAGGRLTQMISNANAASLQVNEFLTPAWEASGAPVLAQVQTAVRAVSVRFDAAAGAAASLWSDLERFASAVRHEEYVSASAHARGMQSGVKSFWKAIRHGGVPTPGTGMGEGAGQTRATTTKPPSHSTFA